MKILVTGGAGFIGGNFVHYMVNKYPEDMIVNLDKLTYAGNLETCKPVEGKPNYKFVKGDIADREFIFDLFKKEKFDVVVNFAAESHVDRSIEDPEIFVKACELIHVAPGDAIGFEDAQAGIQGIKGAGMYAVGVSTGEALDGADKIITHFTEITAKELSEL